MMQFNPIPIPSTNAMLAAYEGGRDRRIRDLEFQRKMEREDGRSAALRDLFGPSSGGPYGLDMGQNGSVGRTVAAAYGESPPAGTGAGANWSDLRTAAEQGATGYSGTEPNPPGSMRPRPPELNQDALRRLMQFDPDMAMKIAELDRDQRAALLEETEKRLEIGGRVFSATIAAPPEQQNAVYQSLREDLEGAGIIDLPDEWDPALAESRLQLGMTVKEALGERREERKFTWDVEDDRIDNEREAQNTESLVRWRETQADLGRERIGLEERRVRATESDPRRVAPDRSPDPNDVVGRIMDKLSRGEQITPSEQRLYDQYREGRGTRRGRGRGGSASGNAATIFNPQTGQRMKLEGGQWVPVR